MHNVDLHYGHCTSYLILCNKLHEGINIFFFRHKHLNQFFFQLSCSVSVYQEEYIQKQLRVLAKMSFSSAVNRGCGHLKA